jgi:phage tail tube protein FII
MKTDCSLLNKAFKAFKVLNFKVLTLNYFEIKDFKSNSMSKNIWVALNYGDDKLETSMRYGSTIADLLSKVREQYGITLQHVYNEHNKILPLFMPIRGSVTFRAEH